MENITKDEIVREKKRASDRAHYQKRKEQQSGYHKTYYEKNKEKILERVKKQQLEKRGGPKKKGRPSKYGTKTEPVESQQNDILINPPTCGESEIE
jgi:hypothetical protein